MIHAHVHMHTQKNQITITQKHLQHTSTHTNKKNGSKFR